MNPPSSFSFPASAEPHAAPHQVLLEYAGVFTSSIVAALSVALRERLDDTTDDRRTARRVFSVFVEMTQNVLHYAAADNGSPRGAVKVTHDSACFTVTCCNEVASEQVERVRLRVEAVRGMSREELKSAYRAQLRNDEHHTDPVSKGAGLGFLTLAREASAPLDYVIETATGQSAYAEFHLRALI